MMQTLWAVIHGGKIELAEPAELPEGAKVLVTFLAGDESHFWADASEKSRAAVWDNAEDDAYAQLLNR
jgi:arabinogalactan endo-1,4-beta-galactosidase